MASQWYQSRWGDKFGLLPAQATKHYIMNDRGGHMIATSTGGVVTGFGGKRLVLDDPHDPEGAESEIQRESTIEWLTRTWPSRLDPVPGASEVLIMQRLHELDATGLYIKNGGYTHIKLPMEYTGESHEYEKRTSINQLLDEKLHSRERVEELKKKLGPYGVAGQLQQEPAPLEGGMVKRAWLKEYDLRENKCHVDNFVFDPMHHYRFFTIDLASRKEDLESQNDPDYTVIAVWCVFMSTRGPLLCLLDIYRERLEGPDQESKIIGMYDYWKPSIVGIETVGYQLAMMQILMRRGLPVRELGMRKDALVYYDKDKYARLKAATPMMADGRFYVPRYAPWLAEYVKELTTFPMSAHDDECDVTSAAVSIAQEYREYDSPRAVRPRRLEDRHPSEEDREPPENPLNRFYNALPRP